MPLLAFILLILAVFYIAGAIFEFPIFFEGNPKTRWMIGKIGRKNHKIVLFACAAILLVVAVILM